MCMYMFSVLSMQSLNRWPPRRRRRRCRWHCRRLPLTLTHWCPVGTCCCRRCWALCRLQRLHRCLRHCRRLLLHRPCPDRCDRAADCCCCCRCVHATCWCCCCCGWAGWHVAGAAWRRCHCAGRRSAASGAGADWAEHPERFLRQHRSRHTGRRTVRRSWIATPATALNRGCWSRWHAAWLSAAMWQCSRTCCCSCRARRRRDTCTDWRELCTGRARRPRPHCCWSVSSPSIPGASSCSCWPPLRSPQYWSSSPSSDDDCLSPSIPADWRATGRA